MSNKRSKQLNGVLTFENKGSLWSPSQEDGACRASIVVSMNDRTNFT